MTISDLTSFERIKDYITVGILGTTVDILTTVLLADIIGLNVILSAIVGIELSILVIFYLNDTVTFSRFNKDSKYKRLLSSHLVRLTGSVIQILVFALVYNTATMTAYDINIWIIISKLCGIMVAGVFNYVLESKCTWKVSKH